MKSSTIMAAEFRTKQLNAKQHGQRAGTVLKNGLTKIGAKLTGACGTISGFAQGAVEAVRGPINPKLIEHKDN